MTRRSARHVGAAAALVLATLLAMPASPAAADTTIEAPAAGAVLDKASVVVSGNAAVDSALGLPLTTFDTVTLTVSGKSATKTASVTACRDKSSCAYSETFTLNLNGPHTVEVVAKQKGLLAGEPTRTSRSFSVAAPAAKPVLDPPTVTEARTVDLSWSRNTEADMLYYAVFRKDPGASKFLPVSGKITQPTTGTKVRFTDTSTSQFAGGDYAYQVVAVRNGASGTDATETTSDPSGALTAAVPVPPTTSTIPGVPGSPAGGPTTTLKPAPPAGVDLSGFLSSRSQPITPPKITVPEPPDTGFSGNLPFGARPPGEELEEGDAEAVPPTGRGSTSVVSIDAARPLVPVAGGLVLLLLAIHMRLLGRRVKAPADRDLPLEAAAGVPARPPATPTRRPQPAPKPAPVPLDVEADPQPDPPPGGDDDAGWAPIPLPLGLQPEPEPEPEPPSDEPDQATSWVPAPDDAGPGTHDVDPDEVEVFEVVSSHRRRLARVGH